MVPMMMLLLKRIRCLDDQWNGCKNAGCNQRCATGQNHTKFQRKTVKWFSGPISHITIASILILLLLFNNVIAQGLAISSGKII